MLLVKHFWRWHVSLFMQLQVLSQLLIGGSRMVLLCLLMIYQLYLIFTLFQLKACVACDVVGNVCQSVLEMFYLFLSLQIYWTVSSTREYSFFAVYLECHWRLFSEMLVHVYNQTDLSRSSWYMGTDSLNTFSFEDKLESLVSIEIGNCFVIEGGWFDSLWI